MLGTTLGDLVSVVRCGRHRGGCESLRTVRPDGVKGFAGTNSFAGTHAKFQTAAKIPWRAGGPRDLRDPPAVDRVDNSGALGRNLGHKRSGNRSGFAPPLRIDDPVKGKLRGAGIEKPFGARFCRLFGLDA